MSYVKAVLKTLSDLGIAETDLSATDFTTISELEKQDIPEEFLRKTLTRRLANITSESLHGKIAELQAVILEEYATSFESGTNIEMGLSAYGS